MAPSGHRLVTLSLDGSELKLLAAQDVAWPLPAERGAEPARPWRARLVGPDGALLHEAALADPTELRAEFADGPSGRIRGQRIHRTGPVVFCLRVPVAGGRLELQRLDPARPREAKPAADAWQVVAAVELSGVRR